jgi:hypothetical protein
VNTAGKTTIDKILSATELWGNSMASPAQDNISSQCGAACRQNLLRKLGSQPMDNQNPGTKIQAEMIAWSFDPAYPQTRLSQVERKGCYDTTEEPA